VSQVSHSTAGARERPSYQPGEAWDEAFTAGGESRGSCAEVVAALADVDLEGLAAAVQADVDAEGVCFNSADGVARFRVDPVPRIVEPQEWELLQRGLAQRVQALIAFVADVYGERAIVEAGVLPARVLESADYLEPDMNGMAISKATYVAGLDVVRDADGRLRVLEDNIRTPSGITYALGARAAVDSHLPLDPPPGRLDPAGAFDLLRDALWEAAPAGVDEPTVVLLSDGPSNSAWYEHRSLAARLGIPLVEPDALSVRGDRLRALTEDGLRDVHVVYRRTDEDRLRDEEGHPTWVAEMLLGPLRAGHLAVVNPFGSGIADDKLVHAYVDDMVRFYSGEEPLIDSVRTYDLGDEDVLRDTLGRLDEMVLKPRSGYGGEGVVVCPHATAEDRAALRKQVEASPADYIAQELIVLSTHPTVCDGRLEPRHVDLRPFAIGSGGSAATAPVALTRVAFDRGALVVNSSQNGGGKDTWLMA
jgi:uncharacterized circularly permuted ATP-grasp superfamily protein